MGEQFDLEKEKHGWNIRNGLTIWLGKRKTWSEYKEWVETFYLKKENMVGIKGMDGKFFLEKEKHGRSKRNGYQKILQISTVLPRNSVLKIVDNIMVTNILSPFYVLKTT